MFGQSTCFSTPGYGNESLRLPAEDKVGQRGKNLGVWLVPLQGMRGEFMVKAGIVEGKASNGSVKIRLFMVWFLPGE